MTEDWKTYKLSELVTLLGDGIHGTPKYSDHGEYYFINGNNLVDGKILIKPDTKRVSKDEYLKHKRELNDRTLLVSINGTIGRTAYYNEEKVMLGKSACYFNIKEGVEKRYIKQVISSKYFIDYLESNYTGSVIKNVSLKSMRELPINLPPLPEQRAIASILSSLDDKIELNLQMNKTLEEMAMALYKHWFVDFGPFQSGKFVDSELGMIPEGWEVKRLEEILKIKHGYAFKGKSFTTDENQNLLLTPGNFMIHGGIKFNWGKQKFYTGEFPSDYILIKGDLIIALTDLTQSCDILGASALIPDEDYLYLHNQRLGLVTDLSPKLSKELVYCLTNTVAFRAHIKNGKTGSTVSHTSPSRIYDYKIALPFKGISEILKEQLFELNDLKLSNLSENKLLIKTRDTLLPKLISGEVRVKDVEKMVLESL